jgi:hypothetical protein
METSNIIVILLFIIPGILAEKISSKMNYPSSKKRSDFNELVAGVALSFPILFIVAIITYFTYEYTTFNEYIVELNNVYHLFFFILITLVVAILLGFFKGLYADKLLKKINWFRIHWAKKMEIDDKSCWRKAFLEDNKIRFLKIKKDGEEIQSGFALHYSLPDEDQEIVFDNPDNLGDYPEYKEYLKLIKTYINIEKGVIIEIYDTTAFEVYLQKIQNKSVSKKNE